MKLDQPSAEVQDNLGRKVRAKILVDAAGRHVRDPMTNMPLIVDEDFDINHAIAFGRTLAPLMDPSSDPSATAAALAAMYFAFRPSGPMDMQRSYNGMVGGGKDEFLLRFRPAASYILGVVGRAAGLSPEAIIGYAGGYRQYQKDHPLGSECESRYVRPRGQCSDKCPMDRRGNQGLRFRTIFQNSSRPGWNGSSFAGRK